ncbi:protein-tyrosine-phosphatase [Acidocella aquatica]|uniref:Protein-tyrosine-phosphatase n=1 Tax=Acidocella aquatica TaxID=1922313 RepID=A0ABQ6A7M8_9PROT|nr:tyrosine-protein phosphatase [Acidocella aquatica]GLR68455.1 protein-tyrosine-phosphatase [Acidocella aquatica]
MSNSLTSALNDPRILHLAGGHNFRDIGGYITAGGKRVAMGRVYRSANLARLTDEDHDLIANLNIRLIFDLRDNRERKRRPSRHAPDAGYEVWARDHTGSTADLISALSAPGATAETSRQKMVDIYKHLAYEQAESYTELFRRIARGDVPLLFHCAAGKDRTGVAAALLLDVLGVPREAVIEDYLLTEHFFEHNLAIVLTDFDTNALKDVEQSIWAPMMHAERAYIESMFSTIEARHGSVENFLCEAIGLTKAELESVRAALLE